jgi:hypothetical protein
MQLSDGEAKDVLRRWPQRTNALWNPPGGRGFWLRASPTNGAAGQPHLSAPGAKAFRTKPDGLYVYFHSFSFCDAICIESCAEPQNLHDKRSRYALASHSLLLTCSRDWLLEDISVQRGREIPRWEAARSFTSRPRKKDLRLPVRHLRVLYSLEDNLYSEWKENHVATGHEYYCRHSSLSTHNSPTTRTFLRGMSLESHFLTLR